MLMLLLVSVVSGIYFYVTAFATGLSAKRWAVAGMIAGPAVLPIFNVQQHIALRRSRGFGNAFWRP